MLNNLKLAQPNENCWEWKLPRCALFSFQGQLVSLMPDKVSNLYNDWTRHRGSQLRVGLWHMPSPSLRTGNSSQTILPSLPFGNKHLNVDQIETIRSSIIVSTFYWMTLHPARTVSLLFFCWVELSSVRLSKAIWRKKKEVSFSLYQSENC